MTPPQSEAPGPSGRSSRTSRASRPRRWPPLTVVGLTGGIASGKSTVAAMFAELGAVVLNADHEGHAALAPGEPGLAEVVAAFGAEYLRPDGTLDRKALGARVFGHPADRAVLNRITHPRIGESLAAKLRHFQAQPPVSGIVVVEAALLVEARWTALVDRVVLVTAQPSTQVRRLIAGFGLNPPEAEARVRSQYPLSRKLRYADDTVSGEAPLAETRAQVSAIWSALTSPAGAPVRVVAEGVRSPRG